MSSSLRRAQNREGRRQMAAQPNCHQPGGSPQLGPCRSSRPSPTPSHPHLPRGRQYLDISSLNCLQFDRPTPSDDGPARHRRRADVHAGGRESSTAAAWSHRAVGGPRADARRHGAVAPGRAGCRPRMAPPAADDDRRLSESAEDTLGLDAATGDCVRRRQGARRARRARRAAAGEDLLPCPAASSASARPVHARRAPPTTWWRRPTACSARRHVRRPRGRLCEGGVAHVAVVRRGVAVRVVVLVLGRLATS